MSHSPSSTAAQGRYVVITPVRDEEKHIEHTILSVVGQICRPVEWVIVNDGSQDGTGAVVDRYAALHPWITALHVKDRGFRAPGTGVIEAFYAGFSAMQTRDWHFVVKLDGDLKLESDYFARCLQEFQREEKLGIGGGLVFNMENGRTVVESNPRFHVRGATKIYRRECWEAIGGLVRAPGWDTLDEVKAHMLGWTTRTFEDIRLEQLKPTGSAQGGWRNAVKNGRGSYIVGYHPLFMLLKGVKRIPQRPILLGAVGLLYGYFRAMFGRVPRVEDPALIQYLRQQQMKRLLLKESIWK